ncbi:MAG: spore germination protein [Bacillota bacterium]|nr:spore germination protein [Bacillota bacterium]
MAGNRRKPPSSPASPLDVLRRLWRGIDPGREGPPRQFSLGERPAPESRPSRSEESRPPDLSADLDQNLERIQVELDTGRNSDVVIRDFELALKPRRRAFLLYIDGLADRMTVSESVLEPLMLLAKLRPEASQGDLLCAVEERLAPGAAISRERNLGAALEKVLSGMTALFLDGSREVLLIESKGWEKRAVGRPQEEPGVRGPLDSFTETLRTNTALIRRRLRTPDLTIENLQVGRLSRTDVAVVYLRGLTNPKLVEEVRRRLRGISVDHLQASGTLEQLVEDRPNSLFSQILTTERPDRAVGFLAEGYVVILVDNNPIALVVPATFTAFFHSADDYYLRWPFGTFARWVRLLAMFLALFLPALYIAATTYHQAMIPPPLLLSIAASREQVPFPTVFEVILMEFSFELVREASLRIPSVMGGTISIVGALILGQAAVSASLISPLLVVVVALTGLGSFCIPNYSTSFSLRINRFILLLLASLAGFFGISMGMFLILLHLGSLQGFGVPYLSPIGPFRPGSPDVVVRGFLQSMEGRPAFVRPQDEERQPPVARRWSAGPEPPAGQGGPDPSGGGSV